VPAVALFALIKNAVTQAGSVILTPLCNNHDDCPDVLKLFGTVFGPL